MRIVDADELIDVFKKIIKRNDEDEKYYASTDELKSKYYRGRSLAYSTAIHIVESMVKEKEVEIRPIYHAYWEQMEDTFGGWTKYRCSGCKRYILGLDCGNYCTFCGARMDGEKEV